jgi:uncharacterized membrane protein YeaQ/YmgE (transglycosylase-associated protein family)
LHQQNGMGISGCPKVVLSMVVGLTGKSILKLLEAILGACVSILLWSCVAGNQITIRLGEAKTE